MQFEYQRQAIENYFEGVHVPDGTFLAGGAVLSLMTGNKINDLDLYFASREAVAEFIEENNGVYLYSVTDKSISLSLSTTKYGTKEFQLIYFDSYNSADEVFHDFDFTVCMCAYSFDDKQFYFHTDFWEHLGAKKLVFSPSTKFPIISLLRVEKYQQKGFSISNGELRKIALAISKLNLEAKSEFIHQYRSMYGLESSVDLFLEEDALFDATLALGKFSKDYQKPTLIFSSERNTRIVVDKPTPYPKEWMCSYLRNDNHYLDFIQQPYYVEVQVKDNDKTYNLIGLNDKDIVENLSSKYPQKVKRDYAKAHIMLYKTQYDPLLKSLNQMVERGEGFAGASKNKIDLDTIDF
jgi:hypothetical protein